MSDDPQPKHIETNGGAFTGGNVDAGGDFIGRDQHIEGDVVKGNKIIIQNTVSSAPLAQPVPTSPTWRRAIIILIGIFSFLGAIATNIATGVLPESWKPYLWVAWPLAVLITGISIWLTLRQSSLEDENLPVPTTVEQRNRQVMLKRVRLDWVDGVLRRSLYQEVLISLGLEERLEAIIRPWDTLVQRPKQEPQSLPIGTKIVEVFDQFGGSLLILGAPGVGKTTMMLELARDLLDRAEQDEKHLMPVVFNLSSWAIKQRPLAEWLVDELSTKYYIPRKLAQTWIDTDQVLPLLDGLDEVATQYRTACVEAINAFHHIHNLVGMVVCSRIADYEMLKTKLHLQEAVLVQPLARQQVDEYLKKLGKSLAGVRAALRDDPNLWELIETPLWLSIVILAYQGISPRKLRASVTPEGRRRDILTTYIQVMFTRREPATRYNQQQTIHWLVWLARSMMHYRQTIFWIEHLQPNWLASNRHWYHIVNAIIVSLIIALTIGFGLLLTFGVNVGLSSALILILIYTVVGICDTLHCFPLREKSEEITKSVKQMNWSWKSGFAVGLILGIAVSSFLGMAVALIFGLIGVLIGALIGGSNDILPASTVKNQPIMKPDKQINWSGKKALIYGAGFALNGGLFYGLIGAYFYDFSGGLVGGLVGGLMVGLVGRLYGAEEDNIESDAKIPLWFIMLGACFWGLVGGLFYGLIDMLTFGLIVSLGSAIVVFGVVLMPFVRGLEINGLVGKLRNEPGDKIEPIGQLDWSWKSGLPLGLSYGLSSGLIFWSIYGMTGALVGVLSGALIGGLEGGLKSISLRELHQPKFIDNLILTMVILLLIGLICGLIGGLNIIESLMLSIGLGIVIGIGVISEKRSYVLNAKLLPNQAIRQSARNAITFGFIGGLSGVLIGGLIGELIGGLIGGLVGLGIYGLQGGGIPFINHGVLRILLYYECNIPFNYARFLDYCHDRIFLRKVGGGYIFIHRMVMEHFASLTDEDIVRIAGDAKLSVLREFRGLT